MTVVFLGESIPEPLHDWDAAATKRLLDPALCDSIEELEVTEKLRELLMHTGRIVPGPFVMSRTYGQTRDCAGCRFWSEMIAKCEGGPVLAMCLADGPLSGKYTTGSQSCKAWKSGHLGAVDPPAHGAEVQRMYAAEDAMSIASRTR